MKVVDAIRNLQNKLHMQFSKEQFLILKHNLSTPTLVNSCAGSGKTMLLICQILLKIETKQNKSSEVLGITFSRDGAKNMQTRFVHYAPQLSVPSFSTFHALFYQLLREINSKQELSVLSSYNKIYFYLIKHIKIKPSLLPENQLLQKIFETRSKLINNDYTYNGLTLHNNINYKQLREGTKIPKLIFGLQKPQTNTDETFLQDYKSIVKAYLVYKQQHHLIDFSDMMTSLWKVIQQHGKAYHKIKHIMAQFKIVCIDEFQDISLVQWRILKAIISQQALNHILLIGDDDQSIYSFRGSNPKIIMNISHKIKSLQVFNLSINYRTAGNILGSVKPLIMKNHVRLPKKLLAKNHTGIIKEYLSNNNRYTANDAMLIHLLHQIHNPKVPNNQIAILVHFNNSRMVLIDWLANHQYYIKANSQYLLHNNSIYRTTINIIKGLLFDKMSYIFKSSIQIGFRKYKRHIKRIVKKISPSTTITYYTKIAYEANQGHQSHITKLDNILTRYNHMVKRESSQYKYHFGKLLWRAVISLTQGRNQFLKKSKMLNMDRYTEISTYLKKQIYNIPTMKDAKNFLAQQKAKIQSYKQKGQSTSLNIMSIHQSKGLEFKYVYLYDLSSQIDNKKDVLLNTLFSPSMSVVQLYRFLLHTPLKKLQKIEIVLYEDTKEHAFVKIARKMRALITMGLTNSTKMISQILQMKFEGSIAKRGVEEQLWQMYHNIIHTSQEIEEERRLIYVGVTRAKRELYIAYNRNADPLLNELKIPKRDKFYLEPSGQILNDEKNHSYLAKILKGE